MRFNYFFKAFPCTFCSWPFYWFHTTNWSCVFRVSTLQRKSQMKKNNDICFRWLGEIGTQNRMQHTTQLSPLEGLIIWWIILNKMKTFRSKHEALLRISSTNNLLPLKQHVLEERRFHLCHLPWPGITLHNQHQWSLLFQSAGGIDWKLQIVRRQRLRNSVWCNYFNAVGWLIRQEFLKMISSTYCAPSRVCLCFLFCFM